MCGLIGYSANKGYEFDINKIKLLLMFNQDRGKDSTGIWTPLSGLNKSTEKAEDYISNPEIINAVIEDITLLGHCRAGTVGSSSTNNAHPFEFKYEKDKKKGSIIFQHNGTLTNHTTLSRKYDIPFNSWDVDSQVVGMILAQTLKPDVLTEVEGAFAFMWTDTGRVNKTSKDNSLLYVVRNEERPLYRGLTTEGMYISSIEKSLKAIGCTDVKQFDTGVIYTIIDGTIAKETPIELKKKYTPTHTNTSNGVNYADPSHYVGKWILSDTKATGANSKGHYDIDREEWYFCRSGVSDGSHSSILEVIKDKKIHWAPKRCFYHYTAREFKIRVGNWVVFMEKVVSKEDNKKVLFRKGDISICKAQVTGDWFEIASMDKKSKEVFDIKSSWIRPLQVNNESKYQTNIYEETEAYKKMIALEEEKSKSKSNDVSSEETDNTVSDFPSNPSNGSTGTNTPSTNNIGNSGAGNNMSELTEEDVNIPDDENLDSLTLNLLTERGELTQDDVDKIIADNELGYVRDMAVKCDNILDPVKDLEEILEDNQDSMSVKEQKIYKHALEEITEQALDLFKEVYNL